MIMKACERLKRDFEDKIDTNALRGNYSLNTIKSLMYNSFKEAWNLKEIEVSQLKVAIQEVRKSENKCAHMQTSYNGQASWCYTCGNISLIEESVEKLIKTHDN